MKDSKNFSKYFNNNKKQKSNIGSLHEEGGIIATDMKIAAILHHHLCTVFTSEILNSTPKFNLSYIKKIETPMTCFRINEQVISKKNVLQI